MGSKLNINRHEYLHVSALGHRARLLHIKDGPATWNDSLPQDNPDPMTAVGKGITE
jgi:hypothetical protein